MPICVVRKKIKPDQNEVITYSYGDQEKIYIKESKK